MRVAFYTLGCKVNQAETGAMEEFLALRGHEIVVPGDRCDAVVVNTCTVTAESDRKSRQAIRRLKASNPGALIAVCGCLPETSDLSAWPEIDLLGGSGNRMAFAEKLEGLREKTVLASSAKREFESIPASALEGRSRAFLKIQDGCENYCAYCIIPRARGKCRSRTPEDALEKAREAYARGYQELVLTGIEISSYTPSLAELVRMLCKALPDMRFRIGSLEPTVPDKAFVGAISGIENLCPHFHLSLQSGCDGILKKMGRRYAASQALESAGRLRDAFPGCAVTGDLICGFPGETEAQFGETLDFLKIIKFSKLHIFPYSRRPGTPAADMPGQLSRAEKRERARLASAIAAETALDYGRAQEGKVLKVLFETQTHGLSGNYQEVTVPSGGVKRCVMPVRITGCHENGLSGEIL